MADKDLYTMSKIYTDKRVSWDYRIPAYHAMEKAHGHACNVGGVLEEAHRHERVLRKPFFAEDEDANHYRPKNNQTDDCWRIPSERSATKFEAQ